MRTVNQVRFRALCAAIAAAMTLAGLAAGAGVANAAPITCPDGQTAVQVSPSEWSCVNNGGNTDQSENPKNPNADKDKF